MSDPIHTILDRLIQEVQSTFHACLLAQTTLQLGGGAIDSIQDNTLVGATLGIALEIEPIPIRELRQYRSLFPEFLLEVFQGKMTQHFGQALSSVFKTYVDWHFSGERPFVELRARDLRLDFTSAEAMESQIRDRLIRDFEFWEFGERQKLIDKIRNPESKHAAALQTVHLHVQIRNAIQHRQGTLDTFVFKKLGCSEIALLAEDGSRRSFREGDRVSLSVPELDAFRRAILLTGQAWR